MPSTHQHHSAFDGRKPAVSELRLSFSALQKWIVGLRFRPFALKVVMADKKLSVKLILGFEPRPFVALAHDAKRIEFDDVNALVAQLISSSVKDFLKDSFN